MEENFISNALKMPVWVAFLISWLFYLIGLFLFSQMVWDSNTYQLNYSGNDFDSALAGFRRIDLLRYILSPVWILTLAAVIWLLFKMGLTIAQTELDGRTLFKIILMGLFFIALPYWVKSIWFVLLKSSYTPDEIIHTFPGTIVQLIDTSNMDAHKIDTLAKINLYHIGFMLFTAWGIAKNSTLSYGKSLAMVLLTYGPGLALTIFFRMHFF